LDQNVNINYFNSYVTTIFVDGIYEFHPFLTKN
jgi:hypothetical protein